MDYNNVEILLVEDDENDAELVIREFRRHNLGNNLIHVRNGEEALEFIFAQGAFEGKRAVENTPRVILLDIQMPKVNGIEVLDQIKNDKRTREIPVVVLTSSKENPDIRKCYAKGANSYIVKPVNFENFAAAIKNIGIYWLGLNQSSTK